MTTKKASLAGKDNKECPCRSKGQLYSVLPTCLDYLLIRGRIQGGVDMHRGAEFSRYKYGLVFLTRHYIDSERLGFLRTKSALSRTIAKMSKASKAMKPNGGKPRPSYTPASSPVLECCESTVTLTVKDLVYTVKEAILEHGVATSTARPNLVLSDGHVESKKTLNRASRQEYKMVNEMYVICEC